jgi:2,3-bisphosphoglycerate-dependent phosphoglycerate mutase
MTKMLTIGVVAMSALTLSSPRAERLTLGSPTSAPAVLRLYLARHGQTDWNLEQRLQGGSDIPLNATGRQQAAALASRLAGVHLDAVYSSQLKRSRETAEILGGSARLTSLSGLNERRLGVFEGRVSSPEYERRSQDPEDALEGGESMTQFFNRIKSTLEGILQRHHSGAILIVGHGGTNQMIVRALFRLSPERAAAFQQANDELYLCEVASGRAWRFWRLTEP